MDCCWFGEAQKLAHAIALEEAKGADVGGWGETLGGGIRAGALQQHRQVEELDHAGGGVVVVGVVIVLVVVVTGMKKNKKDSAALLFLLLCVGQVEWTGADLVKMWCDVMIVVVVIVAKDEIQDVQASKRGATEDDVTRVNRWAADSSDHHHQICQIRQTRENCGVVLVMKGERKREHLETGHVKAI